MCMSTYAHVYVDIHTEKSASFLEPSCCPLFKKLGDTLLFFHCGELEFFNQLSITDVQLKACRFIISLSEHLC